MASGLVTFVETDDRALVPDSVPNRASRRSVQKAENPAAMPGFRERGDWDSLWAALGVDDADFRRLIEESNDPVAIAGAIKGSLTPTTRARCHTGKGEIPQPMRDLGRQVARPARTADTTIFRTPTKSL